MYCKYIFFNPIACCCLYKAKDLSAPPHTFSTLSQINNTSVLKIIVKQRNVRPVLPDVNKACSLVDDCRVAENLLSHLHGRRWGSSFLQNTGSLLPDYTESHPRRLRCLNMLCHVNLRFQREISLTFKVATVLQQYFGFYLTYKV
jgi:hypothetical protein